MKSYTCLLIFILLPEECVHAFLTVLLLWRKFLTKRNFRFWKKKEKKLKRKEIVKTTKKFAEIEGKGRNVLNFFCLYILI